MLLGNNISRFLLFKGFLTGIFQQLTSVAKLSILDVCGGHGYASVTRIPFIITENCSSLNSLLSIALILEKTFILSIQIPFSPTIHVVRGKKLLEILDILSCFKSTVFPAKFSFKQNLQ